MRNEQAIRWKVWKLKENNIKQNFNIELRNWLTLMHPIYEILLKIMCCKLEKKYVDRREVGEIMGIHGGEMKRIQGFNTTKENGI